MGLLSKARAVMIVAGRSGGLLQKMTLYLHDPVPETGVAGKRLRIIRVSRPAGRRGLLQKTLLFAGRQNPEREPGEEEDAGPALDFDYSLKTEALLRVIDLLERDWSFLPALFSLLFRELMSPGGALFIYDHTRESFVALLGAGMGGDGWKTLSISIDRMREFSGGGMKPFIITHAPRFFGGGGAMPGGPLVMIPFPHGEMMTGGMLLSRLQLSPESRASLFDCSERISWKIGEIIDSLLRPLSAAAPPDGRFDSVREAAEWMRQEAGRRNEPFLIVTSPLASLRQTILGKAEIYNIGCVYELVLAVLNSSLEFLGTVTPRRKRDELVFFIRGEAFLTAELLLRHLSGFLRDFFKGLLDTLPVLEVSKKIVFQAEENSPQEILSAL